MALTQIQEVRLLVGDRDPLMPFLSDEEIQYFLDRANGNIEAASLNSAKSILFSLAQYVQQSVDGIGEYYGQEYFKNYKEALLVFIKNGGGAAIPVIPGILKDATPYAGNISKSDFNQNLDDTNVIQVDILESDFAELSESVLIPYSDPFSFPSQ